MIRKMNDFHRCRFCGVICESENELLSGFEEKFKCSLCKYNWVVDVNSSILIKEVFFINRKRQVRYPYDKKVIVDYEKSKTITTSGYDFSKSNIESKDNKKFITSSNKVILFKNHEEIRKYALRHDIIS